MSKAYIKEDENNKQGKPLESIRERQLARGLLREEIEWFKANCGRVPLCDCEVKASINGTTLRCALYGPLPTLEFTQVCMRCQKEISDTLIEEERLYRKAMYTSTR